MKHKVLTLNAIAQKGLETFSNDDYQISDAETQPDAILVRSANMHEMTLAPSVRVIGRAGVGVNTIPVDAMTEAGIPVLNAPGANSNAVKELVITGMLLAARHICGAWNYARQINGDDAELLQQVEKNKKRFSGFELPGKTLGVIGLGHIGVKVANTALDLGMKVIGFDNSITVQNAWKLSSQVEQALSLAEVVTQADFITLHVPLLEQTRNLINSKILRLMKPNAVLLNFARAGIIHNEDLKQALDDNKLGCYVCDFPSNIFKDNEKVIALPHLGASTKEAEENCAVMVSEHVQAYLENGTIRSSVNFPNVFLPRGDGYRVSVANHNVPNIIAQITSAFSEQHVNIIHMINKSKNNIAYNLFDIDSPVTDDILQKLDSIDGVIRVRKL